LAAGEAAAAAAAASPPPSDIAQRDPAAIVEVVDFDETGAVRADEGGEVSLTLPMLQAERREGHRRTRHGKRRLRTRAGEAAVDGLLQPKLFKNQP
jgi:hypothetical protein